MRIELTVLGLLTKGHLYGYDIKKKLAARLSGFSDVKFGSIYYAIKKGVEKGWIKQKGTEKEKSNPERLLYQITPEGTKYFKKGLYNYFNEHLIHFDVDMLIMFIESLDKEQRGYFVEDRIDHINEKLSEIKEKYKEAKKNEMTHINSYIEHHLKAELSWVKGLK